MMPSSDPSPPAVGAGCPSAASPGPGNGKGWVICPLPNEPSVKLLSSIQFTYDELVGAYNQTRVDYIVPMPMNAARLKKYVDTYDVDLELSCVAMEDEHILGLAMLGARPNRTWVTRLGVLPVKRRRGTGQMLMECLIEQSRNLDVDYVTLDVIKNNDPALGLFLKLGFREVRELLIIRRPPGPPEIHIGPYTLHSLDYQQAVELLSRRQSTASWLDEKESLINAGNLTALRVELPTGDRGWLVYQKTVFQLARMVLQTEHGDPHRVGLALAHALHTLHPALDTKSENLPLNCPHWPALQEMGYIESFRRIEMRLDLK
jgi:GNAT superfamily N-acetyltransferase